MLINGYKNLRTLWTLQELGYLKEKIWFFLMSQASVNSKKKHDNVWFRSWNSASIYFTSYTYVIVSFKVFGLREGIFFHI